MSHEIPVNFCCEGAWLTGLLHLPQQEAKRGLVLVVGGPQYRVGSHRQFVLLGRMLAAAGVAVLRFDYRGMGDSEGEPGAPEPCEHLTRDIRNAIDTLFEHVPTLRDVTLWGLCDGASAAALYCCNDQRVSGLVLLNPWISTAHGAATARLKHYYWSRLLDPTLFKRVATGRINLVASARSLLRTGSIALRSTSLGHATALHSHNADPGVTIPLRDSMLSALTGFDGRVLLILSGNDLVAAEFKDMMARSKYWRALLNRSTVDRVDFPNADHTFSRRDWRDQVATRTLDWILTSERGRDCAYGLDSASLAT